MPALLDCGAAERYPLGAPDPVRTRIPLAAIEVLPSGRVALTLTADPDDLGRFIYRAAAEISWEPEQMRFLSPRPEFGPPAKHFQHVAANVADELGYVLVTSPSTRWINVSAEDRVAIEESSQQGT